MSQHEFVEKLTSIRKKLGMTQKAFAALIGIDRAYLSTLENGHKDIEPWIMDRVENLTRTHTSNATQQTAVDAQGRIPMGKTDQPPSSVLLQLVVAFDAKGYPIDNIESDLLLKLFAEIAQQVPCLKGRERINALCQVMRFGNELKRREEQPHEKTD